MTSVSEKLGPFIRLSDFAAKKSLDSQQLKSMIRSGEVVAVPVGNGNAALPSFQFNGGEVVPWLGEAFSRFDKSRAQHTQFALWLREPATELKGKTPIDLLKAGLFAPVLQLASKVGEQRSGK